jgi:hypothetical protein
MKRFTSISSILFIFTLSIITAGVCFGNATTYSGSLSVADSGLVGYGQWNNPSTALSWIVDNTTTPGLWHYCYNLVVPTKDISHIIIEASDGNPDEKFTLANLFGWSSNPSGWIGSVDVQTFNPGGSTPYMPEAMWGIKFDGASDSTNVTICFDSDRMPVWGDFYSKDGITACIDQWNVVYNAGFTINDLDPLAAAANGSLNHHLLVPDTYVPAPAALVLVGIGSAIVGALRRRGII